MYTKLSGEFDYIELAESAARMIRERIAGQKKIIIYKNKGKFRNCAENRAELAISEGHTLLMYPFSTHSNNFLTGMVTREADESQVNELLRTKSVRMEVLCENDGREKALQYISSCGGYDVRG